MKSFRPLAFIVGLVFLVTGLSAGCNTVLPTVDSSSEDQSGLDGNWVAFTNPVGLKFWMKKDLRSGKWEIWWWDHEMTREAHLIFPTGIVEDGQELLLAPGWQLVRTNQ